MLDDMLQRYALVSHLLLACSIGHISTTVNGFYDIITRFLSNKTCLAILYNYCLMLFMFCCKIPIILFLGQLSQLETEQLVENIRNYIMDTILFLVLSKPRYNNKEVLMSDLVKCITILVSLKSFHVMLYIRLSHMFEVEVPRFFKIFRITSFIYILSLVNCFLLNLFLKNINKKNTFTIWIIFELLGMLESLLFSAIKFIINLIDLYQTNGLVNKVTLLFYIELLHDITSLLTFTIFMILFFVNNPINIPIYMIIDIIHVAKNLTGRIKMLIEYRKLSKVLDTRFPTATKEEVASEGTCIICRDNLDEHCKKIDCGHIFHLNCLKSWFFQHSNCPACRAQINSSTFSGASPVDFNQVLFNAERTVVSFIRRSSSRIRRAFRRYRMGHYEPEITYKYRFNLRRRYLGNFRMNLLLCLKSPYLDSKRQGTEPEKPQNYEYFVLDENFIVRQIFTTLNMDNNNNNNSNNNNNNNNKDNNSNNNNSNNPSVAGTDNTSGTGDPTSSTYNTGGSVNMTSDNNDNLNNLSAMDHAEMITREMLKRELSKKECKVEVYLTVLNVMRRNFLDNTVLMVPVFREAEDRGEGEEEEHKGQGKTQLSDRSKERLTDRSRGRDSERGSFRGERKETSREKILLESLYDLMSETEPHFEGGLYSINRKLLILLPFFLSTLLLVLKPENRPELLEYLSNGYYKYIKDLPRLRGNCKTLSKETIKKEHVKFLACSDTYHSLFLKLKKEKKLDFSKLLFNFKIMQRLLYYTS